VTAETSFARTPRTLRLRSGQARPGLHDLGYIFGTIKNAAWVGRVVILSLDLFYQFGGSEVDISEEIYLAWIVWVKGKWGGLGA
jgi:hypothetical protein